MPSLPDLVHVSDCIFAWYIIGFGASLKVRLSMDTSQKKRCISARASVNRTHSPGLAARLTEGIQCLYGLWSQRWKQTPVSTSHTSVVERSFLSSGCLSHHVSSLCRLKRLTDTDGGSDGQCECCCGRAEPKVSNAKVRAPRRRPSSWRRRRGRTWENIWGCSVAKEALSQIGPGSNQFNFQVRWGWTFLLFSSLDSSDTRRTCVLWF